MTQDVTTLVLGVDSSGVRRASKDLDDFSARGKRAETAAGGLSSSVKALGAVVSVGAVAALAKQALQMADSYTNMSARLSLVTRNAQELANVQRALFSVSQNTRTDLEQTSTLYTRLATSTESLGVSQRDLVGVTESINKALVISGTSAASALAALVQLGQGFASGVLRGEELNSVLEQAPRLATAIADGLGVPVGKLRELGAAGEITAEKLFRALQASGASLSAEFDKMPVTVGGATTQVSNSILQLVGTLDTLTGTSSTVSKWASQFTTGLDGINSRVAKSGGVVRGYLDAISEDYARARLEATRAEIDRMAGAVKNAQAVLNKQPDSIYAKNTLREFEELTSAAKKYEADIKRVQGIDVSAKASAPSGGRQRDVSSTTLSSVSAALAREQAALGARREFLKDYATAEEKFTAELKKQKEAQGDLFTAEDEARLRKKFMPQKGSQLDFVKGDVGDVQRSLEQLTSVYADAERVLEATRSAGLISERKYYDEKLIFLELNTAAQLASLKAENEAIEARARKGQKGLEDDRKVADNLAQIDILQGRAAASAKVMQTEQAGAAAKAKLGFDEARASAEAYLSTVAKQNQRELSAMGQGDKAAQRAREQAEIEDRYQRQVEEAQGELRRGQITEKQLQDRLSLIADTQGKEIALWRKHSANIDAAQGDWLNGVTSSLQNYVDSTANAAATSEAIFTRQFRNMEDALVQFATTGKLNFKQLATSIIQDLVRVQAQAAMSSLFSSLMGGGGNGSVGNAGAGDYKAYFDSLQGARAIGGPVSADSMYQVNERGPELLNVGSKQYLMTGDQGGSVSPNAGGPAQVNHINVQAGVERNEVVSMIQLAMNAVRSENDSKLRKAGVIR